VPEDTKRKELDRLGFEPTTSAICNDNNLINCTVI
jgi:hypothetical protein